MKDLHHESKVYIFTPKTCLLVTAEMEDCFSGHHGFSLLPRHVLKPSTDKRPYYLHYLHSSLATRTNTSYKLSYYGQLKEIEKSQWYERKSIKLVHANINGRKYNIIFSQYVLFECAHQNYTMAIWQISFLVLPNCVRHSRSLKMKCLSFFLC